MTEAVARGLSPGMRAEKVPAVPRKVEEHGEPSVPFISRFRDELNAVIEHSLHHRIEVVNTQKQPDSACELTPDRISLLIAIGPCEHQTFTSSGRLDDHPALRTTIVGIRRRVLTQLEAQAVDEEPDRLVVVLHDERHVLDVHGSDPTTRPRIASCIESIGRRVGPRSLGINPAEGDGVAAQNRQDRSLPDARLPPQIEPRNPGSSHRLSWPLRDRRRANVGRGRDALADPPSARVAALHMSVRS